MDNLPQNRATIDEDENFGPLLRFLYTKKKGQLHLRVIAAPWFSKLGGIYLNSSISKNKIKRFVKRNNIDLSDYPKRNYTSFNDFFTRSIIPSKRPFNENIDKLPAPCDGKLTVFHLEENKSFIIKGCDYTLDTLLRNDALAAEYRGGWGLLFRLSIDDYHRYCYPVSGEKTENTHIDGVYHTVRPTAAASRAIYKENTREYTQIYSNEFGNILMMEVGAMLVGKITNLNGAGIAVRGNEKGYFEFGGSSIIILTEPGRFKPDEDILTNSELGKETIVKMGEAIGTSISEKQKNPETE